MSHKIKKRKNGIKDVSLIWLPFFPASGFCHYHLIFSLKRAAGTRQAEGRDSVRLGK
jgi:hypothetical protein